MIKAALFDLDGTLVCTSAEYRYRVTSKALARFSLEKDAKEIDRLWFKPGRTELIKSWGLDPRDFWNVFFEYDTIEARKKGTKPFKDCHVLDELKDMGLKLGLVTGSHMKAAQMEIDMLGIDFDAVVRANIMDGVKPKPHPHGIMDCLEKLDVRAEDAIFVGNSEEDILSAQNAGVLDVFIDRGENELDGLEPSIRVKTLKDVLNLINTENKKQPKGS